MMQPIILTEAAVTHIRHMLLKQSDAIGFRLSLKKTGCSGYAYVPLLIQKVVESDVHFVQDNISVYIDIACLEFMKGVTVDYVEDNTMGLKQKRLIFINPNEKNRCGCGESFTVESSNNA